MTTESVVPLTEEEIALRDAEPYAQEEIDALMECALRKCSHDVVHTRPGKMRTFATISARDREIATLESKLREAEGRIEAARKISNSFPRWCEEKIIAVLDRARTREEREPK